MDNQINNKKVESQQTNDSHSKVSAEGAHLLTSPTAGKDLHNKLNTGESHVPHLSISGDSHESKHQVTKGESLWKISETELKGHHKPHNGKAVQGMVDKIVASNKDRYPSLEKNPHQIDRSMTLVIPPIDEKAADKPKHGGKAAEQAKPVDTKAAEHGKPVGGKASEQAKAADAKAPEQVKPVGGKASEQAKPVDAKAPEQAKPVDGKAPEQAKPVDVKAPEQAKPVDSKAPEQAKPGDIKAPHPSKPSDAGDKPEHKSGHHHGSRGHHSYSHGRHGGSQEAAPNSKGHDSGSKPGDAPAPKPAHHAPKQIDRDPKQTDNAPKPGTDKALLPHGDTKHAVASWYHEGARTATGEKFNPDGLTVASLTIPMGTKIEVTNPANGNHVIARVNDHGPYVDGRDMDLSRGVAKALSSKNSNIIKKGVVPVTFRIVN